MNHPKGKQSLRQHQWDPNTRYRDSKRFRDEVPLEKGSVKLILFLVDRKSNFC